MGRPGTTHCGAGAMPRIVRPSAKKYACIAPLPPLSAAGLVHAATIPGSATLPNRVLSGGGDVALNDTYVTRQPICDGFRQSGTCRNDPPTSLPCGTDSVAPRSTADTSCD